MNQNIKSGLQKGLVKIIFTKKDGSTRELLGTLNEQLIPLDMKPTGNAHEPNLEVQPVYDVENDGWRSFRWDSVLDYQVQ